MLRFRSLLLSTLVLGPACADGEVSPSDDWRFAVDPQQAGQPGTLDVATWNIEWFGNTGNGPSNEPLQRENVGELITSLDFDLWAVQEIVSASAFGALMTDLDGYVGLIASDPAVEGNQFYHSGEMKVGVILREDAGEIVDARTILQSHESSFAGRPPLEVEIELADPELSHMFVIVLHAKARAGFEDWSRRRDGAEALFDYLVDVRPNQPVLVIGDFNDELDQSIRSSQPSPYAVLVDNFTFATEAISQANTPTTVSGSLPIDHAMVAGSLETALQPGTEVFQAEDFIPNYGNTTSDHLPVLLRFAGSGQPPPPPPPPSALIINEILANEPGGDVSSEFIEIFNPGSSSVSLAGWSISDAVGVRHQFGSGDVLAAGEALVVTGGAVLAGVPSVAASSGGLGFNNSGDTVTLAHGAGGAVDTVAYGSGLGGDDGVSMTRQSDGNGSTPMVSHLDVAATATSPGRRANGAPF